jgi:hypothetical protein
MMVLELLAMGNAESIEFNINKIPVYKRLLHAQEAWVVHFTCEDDYLEEPYWQSHKLLDDNIYMAHIWYSLDFTEVRINARWKSWYGEVQLVNNESVI